MELNIFIVEDHQMMFEGYKTMLSFNEYNFNIEYKVALNCETAYNIITNPENKTIFDLIILDHSIKPAFPEEKIYSGLELGVLIRLNMPTTKIIMITSFTESITLFEVVKKFQPNGLLLKSDYNPEFLSEIVKKVLDGETYYSPAAVKSIKEPLLTTGALDKIDREIIVLIAEGLQISSIAKKLNASDDTIKKRKSKIKDLLGILKGSDEDILRECRALGLI